MNRFEEREKQFVFFFKPMDIGQMFVLVYSFTSVTQAAYQITVVYCTPVERYKMKSNTNTKEQYRIYKTCLYIYKSHSSYCIRKQNKNTFSDLTLCTQ